MKGLSLHIPEHGSGTSDTGMEGVDVLSPTAEQRATWGRLEGAQRVQENHSYLPRFYVTLFFRFSYCSVIIL